MTFKSKRMTDLKKLEEVGEKTFSPLEAFSILKKVSRIKFIESIDVAINLGINPKRSDQTVRGSSILRHGTGKSPRVAVFATGDKAKEAQDAGADIIGLEDLVNNIKSGLIDFDLAIATPETMSKISAIGKILGPKGLMPNPKMGTVSSNINTAVKNAKSGQVRYRSDKYGIIHTTIGKINFDNLHLKENLEVLVHDIHRLKPSGFKGHYVKKIHISSTMGIGLSLDISSLES